MDNKKRPLDKELLEKICKDEAMFCLIVGSLISADSNMTPEEEADNKKALEEIVSALTDMRDNGSSVPHEDVERYLDLATKSLGVFEK